MYFESMAIIFLVIGILMFAFGLFGISHQLGVNDRSLDALMFIAGLALLVVSITVGLLSINYTVTGVVCKVSTWDGVGNIQIEDKWYTIPSKNQYLNINVGDTVIIDIVEITFGDDFWMRRASVIESPSHVGECNISKCNCSVSGA